ncbi:TIGR04279 domain-containing protein [Methanosarcina sp.]|uniref:TIGR04279 domain-containing protein n=1 Tax=Methanosarcina sp. TaxID=2213 RepID=UPI003C707132
MKRSLLIIALTLFILTSATAIADNNEKHANPIGDINFTDRVVYIVDHTSDPEEGNWITMGCPSEERKIQLPQPIKLTYSGLKFKKYGGASGTLYKDENESYTITYPSNSLYLTHPVYLPGENVNMSFHGDCSLKGAVEIYLFNITSESTYGIFDAFNAGDIGNLDSLFHSNMDGEYTKYSAAIGKDGDILNHNFGPLNPGQYCIVIVQQDKDGSLTALSATAFIVAEHELCASAPSSITKGENLDIIMGLKNVPDKCNCTYGAVLIRDQAYKANIEIDSDGTKNGTSVTINEIDLIEEFNVSSSNYRSKFTRDELQTEIQTIIGEGKGSIAIGEKGQDRLSLTAFDLPPGCYYLLAGAYNPGKGLVGLTQIKVEIKSPGSSNGDGKEDNKNKDSKNKKDKGAFPESEENVYSKEQCKQFINSGSHIKFGFTEENTCVNYLKFNSKKTTESTIAIVEELREKSALVTTKPEGEIYSYINIQVGDNDFAKPDSLEDAIVGFKVSKDWIAENHISTDSIVLQHCSGKLWNPLPTKKISEDKNYVYFEAETPSFSPFAITARKNITVIEEAAEAQGSPELKSPNEPNSNIESYMIPHENKSQIITKLVNFSAGFLIVFLIGMIIIKKKGHLTAKNGDSKR